jgi:hypothetical protein
MRFIATLVGALALTLGTPARAHDTPAHHGRVTIPGGVHWIKCPGDPRLMMACYAH